MTKLSNTQSVLLASAAARADLRDRVQESVDARARFRTGLTSENRSPLKGLIFDHKDGPLTPSHASEQGVRYR